MEITKKNSVDTAELKRTTLEKSAERNTSGALALLLCLNFSLVKNLEKNIEILVFQMCPSISTQHTLSDFVRILAADLPSIIIHIVNVKISYFLCS